MLGSHAESCMILPSSEGTVVVISAHAYRMSCECSSLKDLLPVFNDCTNIFLEKLRPLADGKTEVSMKEAFHEVALDVISKVLE